MIMVGQRYAKALSAHAVTIIILTQIRANAIYGADNKERAVSD